MTQPSQTVQPQPTPVSWTFGEARVQDGTSLAIIRFDLVTGSTVLFLNAPDFGRFADAVSQQASRMLTRPIVATSMPPFGGQLPGGNGHGRG